MLQHLTLQRVLRPTSSDLATCERASEGP